MKNRKKISKNLSILFFLTLFAQGLSANLSVVSYSHTPLINKIETDSKNVLFLLKNYPKRNQILYPVKEFRVIAKTDFIHFKNIALDDAKLTFEKRFPSRSYGILIEKMSEKRKNFSAGGECIAISAKNTQPFDAKKKLKVTIVFKSVDNLTPEQDVESYAIIYLDKKKIGITEQKLLSQMKSFDFETSFERHLLRLEVFVQDQYRKSWTRLKNIDQPPQKYFLPQEGQEGLNLVITYYPKNEKDKYTFEGNFYK